MKYKIRLEDDRIVEVEGEEITHPLSKTIKLVVHKTYINGDPSDKWVVSVIENGCRVISPCETKEQAITEANKVLKEYGLPSFKKTMKTIDSIAVAETKLLYGGKPE